ncbi:MAG: pyridoxal-phosphate dependent enzyme [Firmicutes bacterium]|nr:pyridoxal-phosphate dependent enzyme [Bacillota bacterium]
MDKHIYGPTFEEMLHPEKIDPQIREKALKAKKEAPLDPINLFNITWKDENSIPYHIVLPKEFTGVDANIIVMYGKEFPTGSHKVGATYSVTLEHQIFDKIDSDKDTLVWPSTGNYGIGGAFVGTRMGYDSVVILPELMSKERFEKIESYGARAIKTPGCESNVKEIYDKTWELRKEDPKYRIMNQFEEMGNYRFHYHVTGNTAVELVEYLKTKGIGNGRCAAFCSSMGSSGTIAAGDRLKQVFPEHKIIGLEPIQCPTLYNNGYGGHDIQGIGDKHVTWIHNVWNMDAIMCIDDVECKKALQAVYEEAGQKALIEDFGCDEATVKKMKELFGISGICNILGAIKTAKYYEMGKDENLIAIATDSMDRYYSVMEQMTETYGKMDQQEARHRIDNIVKGAKLDWIREGDHFSRSCWHNLKYYTWVEQQGKTVEELNAQKDPQWWVKHQQLVSEMDALLVERRKQQTALV